MQNSITNAYKLRKIYIALTLAVAIFLLSISRTSAQIEPQNPGICNGTSIVLIAPSGETNYQWSPSTGLNATTGDTVVASPTITTTYTVIGYYLGNPDSATTVVTVYPSPNKPTFIQNGDTLISSSSHDNQWFRNDTMLVNDTNQHLIFYQNGTYWVTITNEANGCSTTSDSIYESVTCNAAFSYSYVTGSTLDFTSEASSAYTITSYSWHFGDGATSTAQNPSHHYSVPGTYDVSFVINASNGCEASDSQYIQVPQPVCNASFTYTTSGDSANLTSTSTSNGTITRYAWSIQYGVGTLDTGIAAGASALAIFPGPGGYYVCLTIYSDSGCTSELCDSITILPNCSASFTYNYATGSTLNFTGQAYSSHTITSYSWNFGDGNTSSSESPTHHYSSDGLFTVIFTMGASNGCTAADTQRVQVPQATCNAAFNYVVSSDTVYFTNTSTSNGAITSYNWNFDSQGTSDTSSSQNPIYVYSGVNDSSVYTCLTIQSDSGCTNTACENVILNSGSLVILPINPITCSNNPIVLTAPAGGTNYVWSPSTGLNTTTGQTVLASPTTTTNYTVTFEYNGQYDTVTLTDIITIIASPNKPTFYQSGDTLISSSKFDNQWFRNDTLLQGDSSQDLIITTLGEYFVTVTNMANGCSTTSDTMAIIIIIGPSPLNITPAAPLLCTGQSVVLSVPSSGSDYEWSPATGLSETTGDSVIATPSVTTTYTVTGLNYLGQNVSGTDVVTVISQPATPVIFFSQTGDSLISSASEYNQWLLNGSTIQGDTTQICVPNVNGYYKVEVGDPANGCGAISDSILIERELVWPGDANDDLVVNNYDLIPIGLYYGLTGTARDTTTNLWAGHSCVDWDSVQANGINLKFADCNGDGVINADDTAAISLNYGLSHPLDVPRSASERASGTVPLSIVADSNSYHAGSTVHASVLLGNSESPASGIYGVAYNITLDNSLVTPGTLVFKYDNSFLGTIGNNALTLTHVGSDIETAIVGTDHSDKSGYDKIGDLYFTINSSSSQLGLSISSYEATDAQGKQIGLATGINLNQLKSINNKFSIYPNPTTGAITLVSENTIDDIKVTNVLGQLVYEAQPKQSSFNFELKDDGTYFISVTSNNGIGTQKIIVAR